LLGRHVRWCAGDPSGLPSLSASIGCSGGRSTSTRGAPGRVPWMMGMIEQRTLVVPADARWGCARGVCGSSGTSCDTAAAQRGCARSRCPGGDRTEPRPDARHRIAAWGSPTRTRDEARPTARRRASSATCPIARRPSPRRRSCRWRRLPDGRATPCDRAAAHRASSGPRPPSIQSSRLRRRAW